MRVINGLGETGTTNGSGNLIMGYNESRASFGDTDTCTGSHNMVVRIFNKFSSYGELVAGLRNEISAICASVSGGQFNTASGVHASVAAGITRWQPGAG